MSIPTKGRRALPLLAGLWLVGWPLARTYAQGAPAPPVVTGATKSQYCLLGDLLTLTGANFGSQGDRGSVTVLVPLLNANGLPGFQEFPLSIKSWSDTQVQARLFMPTGAQPGAWVALLHRADGAVVSLSFTTALCPPVPETSGAATPLPVITGINKTQFRPNDALILDGQNFGLNPNGGFVTLVGAFQDSAGRFYYREFPTPVGFWGNFRIQVLLTMPPGAQPGVWGVTVHRGDGETASHEFTLLTTVVPPPPPPSPPVPATTGDCLDAGDPVVEDFQKPTFCAEGDFLIIHGSHFCNDPAGGYVTITAPFRDAQGNLSSQEFGAAVTAWLSTQIQIRFAAPPGAVPGTYTATVHVHRRDSAGRDVIKTASGSFTVVSCGTGP